VNGERRIDCGLGRGRGEDVADRGGVGETLADIAQEGRLMARPSADDQRDLSCAWTIAGDYRARRVFRPHELVAVRGEHALEHLVDGVVAVVDELLRKTFGHPAFFLPAGRCRSASPVSI
jgi:hypothetical protein